MGKVDTKEIEIGTWSQCSMLELNYIPNLFQEHENYNAWRA